MTGFFTIYKRFPENPVGKQIKHDLGRSSGKFPGAKENLKRQSCFPGGMSKRKVRVPFLQSHL